MKYIALTLIVATVMLSGLTSCKKDYTCECTFKDSTRNFSINLGKRAKNDAKVMCTEYNTYIGNCSIK